MILTVEFLGLSRRLTQVKDCLVVLDGQASFRDVLRYLASRFPALVGPVILPGTFDLSLSYMINVDGRQVVKDLDTPAKDNQQLLLMFTEAGG